MYLQGDRQQNSHVLAGKITNNLMSGEIDREMVSKIIKDALVHYFHYMDCERLDKQIELFEQYKVGKSDVPVNVCFRC